MSRPRLLDLFCGAGGCSVGYHRAGFDVTGVDNRNMPNHPGHRSRRVAGFKFWWGEALAYLAKHAHRFDAIHASPPCQAYTAMRNLDNTVGKDAVDLIDATRAALTATGKPWVIENVPGSPLARGSLLLCGSMFGLGVRRHRLFESNVMLLGMPCRHGRGWPVAVWGDGRPSRQEARRARRCVGVYGSHPDGNYVRPASSDCGRQAKTLREGQEAMGICWMTWKELTQAIPPAYTEFVGRQLLAVVHGTAEKDFSKNTTNCC